MGLKALEKDSMRILSSFFGLFVKLCLRNLNTLQTHSYGLSVSVQPLRYLLNNILQGAKTHLLNLAFK